MFAKVPAKCSCLISDDEVLEISRPTETSFPPPEKCSKADSNLAASSVSSSFPGENDETVSPAVSDIKEEPEVSPEELEKEARLKHGDEAVDSTAVADNIAK
jgi:hypothetical protein